MDYYAILRVILRVTAKSVYWSEAIVHFRGRARLAPAQFICWAQTVQVFLKMGAYPQIFLYKQRLKTPPKKILNSGCSRHIYPRLLIPAVVERHNPLKRRTLLLWLLSHCQAKRRFVRLLSPYTDVNIQGQRKHYPKQLAGFCLLEVTPRIRASLPSRWSAQTTFQCQIFLRDVSTMEASSLHGAPWLFVVGGDLQTALSSTLPWGSGRVEFLAICWSATLLE